MTDRIDLRLSDLTRTVEAQRIEIAELRADLAALAWAVQVIKANIPEFRVEDLEQRNAPQVEAREVAPCPSGYSEDAYERFRKWYETHGRGAALALLQKDEET